MRLGPKLQKTSSLTLNISPSCTLEVKLEEKKAWILISLHTADPHLSLNVCFILMPWQESFKEEGEPDYHETGLGKDLFRKQAGQIIQAPSLRHRALKTRCKSLFCPWVKVMQSMHCFPSLFFFPSPRSVFLQPNEYLITSSKGATPTGDFWTGSGRLKAEGRGSPMGSRVRWVHTAAPLSI